MYVRMTCTTKYCEMQINLMRQTCGVLWVQEADSKLNMARLFNDTLKLVGQASRALDLAHSVRALSAA